MQSFSERSCCTPQPTNCVCVCVCFHQGWVTTRLVPISIVIFLGASMNRLQRSGYLQRRKLREQKNGAGLKSE